MPSPWSRWLICVRSGVDYTRLGKKRPDNQPSLKTPLPHCTPLCRHITTRRCYFAIASLCNLGSSPCPKPTNSLQDGTLNHQYSTRQGAAKQVEYAPALNLFPLPPTSLGASCGLLRGLDVLQISPKPYYPVACKCLSATPIFIGSKWPKNCLNVDTRPVSSYADFRCLRFRLLHVARRWICWWCGHSPARVR